MDHDYWFGLISVALGVLGAVFGAGGVVARQIGALDRRFESLEKECARLGGLADSNRLAIQSHLDMINYKLETVFEYRINANKEAIEHKAKRLEEAIKSLSGALERVSEGRYVPRGQNQWPTGDTPTDIR